MGRVRLHESVWLSRASDQRRRHVSLTKREWQLLSFFLTNPNQFFSAEEVVLSTWGPDASIEQFRSR